MMHASLRRGLLTLVFLVGSVPAVAQVHLGADLVSRYVWRGYDFGESFSIQPALAYSAGGFTVGTWASYSVAADGALANEHDLYVSYATDHLSFGVTDYYFPSGGPGWNRDSTVTSPDFFNFEDDGQGAHTVEPFVRVTGPAAFPITFYGAVNVYNDSDYSVYLEVSYPFTVKGVDVGVTAGMTPTQGNYADELAVVNLGLSASKAVPVTDTFSLPVGVSYIVNPYTERSFLVFGVSL